MAARTNLMVTDRNRYPFGSIQNFAARAMRNSVGTHVSSVPNMGGNVKRSAAASQRSGRRGMRVSLLRSCFIRRGQARADSDENELHRLMAKSARLADVLRMDVVHVRPRSPRERVAKAGV